MTKNPFRYDPATSQRQLGRNTPVTGEAHGQKKASKIAEDRRYDGAEDILLVN